MTYNKSIDAYKTASLIASVLSTEFKKNPNFLKENQWCITFSTHNSIALVRKNFIELLSEPPLSIVNLDEVDGYQSFNDDLSNPVASAFIEADIDRFSVKILNALLSQLSLSTTIEMQKTSPQPLTIEKQSIFHSPFSRANYGNVVLWIEKNPEIFYQANNTNIHHIISKNKPLIDEATSSLTPNEKQIFIGLIQEYFNNTTKKAQPKDYQPEQTNNNEGSEPNKNVMTLWFRLVGGIVLFFNLVLIGHFNIEGLLILILTFGFVIFYEFLIIKPLAKVNPKFEFLFLVCILSLAYCMIAWFIAEKNSNTLIAKYKQETKNTTDYDAAQDSAAQASAAAADAAALATDAAVAKVETNSSTAVISESNNQTTSDWVHIADFKDSAYYIDKTSVSNIPSSTIILFSSSFVHQDNSELNYYSMYDCNNGSLQNIRQSEFKNGKLINKKFFKEGETGAEVKLIDDFLKKPLCTKLGELHTP